MKPASEQTEEDEEIELVRWPADELEERIAELEDAKDDRRRVALCR